MRKIFTLLALLLATACTAMPTPTTQADKLAMAQKLVELSLTPEVWQATYRSYADEMIARTQRYESNCDDADDPKYCRTVFSRMMKNLGILLDGAVADTKTLRTSYVEASARLYAESYTGEELAASLAFSESPVGKSMRAKAAAIQTQMSAMQYDKTRVWSEGLQERVAQFMESYGDAFAGPPPES